MSFLKKLAARTKEVAEQAAAAAAAAFEEIKVTDEQREERYAMCRACEHFLSTTTSCTKCGCFMAAKTYLSGAECPIGKWQRITIVPKKEG